MCEDADVSDDESTIADPCESLDDCLDQGLQHQHESLSLQNLRRNRHSPKRQRTEMLVPLAFARVNTRRGTPKPKTLKVLFDSGGSATLISARHAQKLRQKRSQSPMLFNTLAGTLKADHKAKVQFCLPEFHDDRLIEWDMFVAPDLGNYDMIIGRDILTELGMELNFQNHTCKWDEASVPMRPHDATAADSYHVKEEDDEALARIQRILDAKYEAADIDHIAQDQDHLQPEERQKLRDLLKEFEDLFDGTLGKWKGPEYEIELKDGATPYHARPYPIPKAYEKTLRSEVDRLCREKVLKKVNRSEWGAPSFIIPKKDGTVRFINDFRELNKRIKRKPFPIPKIQDLLLKLEGFQYATSLDLNMGYYHIVLSPNSKRLCTIVLPWGKYELQRLPMGLCNSPDIFQERMSSLFEGLEFVRAYIDDLLTMTKGDFDDHLSKLRIVLQRLRDAGLKVNAKKSFFARSELEYLGYWISRTGIQPVAKKVQAIQSMTPPTNKKDLRRFIGMVNYYRDMWIRRSELMTPLTALTSKTVPWNWTPTHTKAFNDIKKVIS